MPTKLGQNFLNNRAVIDKIIQSADLSSDDFVLEIGPGKGILTEKLAENSRQVIAVEIDRELLPTLQSRFANQSNVQIIHADILKINLPELLRENKISSYKLIANIPYYITAKIIRLFLETKIPPTEIILMVQKEVAEQIVAKPGRMSKLAVSIQYYAQPEILFTVDKKNFTPEPKVDSAVIKISDFQQTKREFSDKFFRIVRAGFCARRKTLLNNLSNSLHLPKNEIAEKLKLADLSANSRAQELSVEDWKKLTKQFT